MSRKQFIQSHGATCDNWQWSWSFVNSSKRFVIFGAWENDSTIFSESWKINAKGRKSSGFRQSKEHLRLVQMEGFKLFTFPMTAIIGDGGIPKIKSFLPELAEKTLLQMGSDWLAVETYAGNNLAEELPKSGTYPEGAKTTVTINAYERNPKARAACIAHHGYVCVACGFDFADRYGDLGKDYIHVHHVNPLKNVTGEYEVDPVNDLVPVCPNCHAMIHRVDPCLTIEVLKERLNR